MNSGWERVRNGDEDKLVKEFDRGDFKGAVAFLNAILPIAESANHHPDIAISWKTVEVTLTTHSEGGVTDKDFALAEAIDALPTEDSA
ncbi:MAG: 4a-hydroxytetrahydrobiopterin dehydratase [Solirubrobacterales bacterium]